MADATQRADVDRPSAILAVTILGVVGSIVFLLLPLLVGAFTEALGLDARQAGYLGSADMAGMFLAAVAATLWVRRADWRLAAVLATGLLLACHLASAYLEELAPLQTVRVAAGFAGGSLMSIALTSLGDARNPDRYFALFISGQLGLGALALWRMPALIAAFGLSGIFVALALLTALAGLTIPLIPRRGRMRRIVSGPGSPVGAASAVPGALALVGCLAFNVGIMAVWAYMERIADAAGLDPRAIGAALGASLLAGLAGALVAAAVADRFGRVPPIVFSLALQAVALWLISGTPTAAAFAAGVAIFAFCWNFPVAYQLAITVSVDGSGRLVVLFLSAVKLGYAIGPVIAGALIAAGGGFGPAIALGGLCFVVSTSIYVPLAALAARQKGER